MVTIVFSAIVGGVIGYHYQRLLQEKAQKHGLQKELNEQVYYHLLDALRDVRIQVNNLSFYYSLPRWGEINAKSLHYKMPKAIRDKVFTFFTNLHEFENYCSSCKRVLEELIKKDIQDAKKDKNNERYIEENNKRVQVETFGPYNAIVDCASRFALQRASGGGYHGSIFLPRVGQPDFERMKQHFDLEGATLEDYSVYIYNKTKDHLLLKTKEDELKAMLQKTDNTIAEIEQMAGVNK